MQIELFLIILTTVLLPFSGVAVLSDRTLNRRYSRRVTVAIWIVAYLMAATIALAFWATCGFPDPSVHYEHHRVVRLTVLFCMFIMMAAEMAVTCLAYAGKPSARVFVSLLMSTLCFTMYTFVFCVYHIPTLVWFHGPEDDSLSLAAHALLNILIFAVLYRILPVRLANVISKAGGDMSRHLGFPLVLFVVYVLDYSDQICFSDTSVSSVIADLLMVVLYAVCMVLFLERTTGSLEIDRYREELDAAALIQRSMVPDRGMFSRVPGFRIAGFMLPAKEVGGDLYDIVPLPGDRTAMVIADVSGKGVPAALMAMRTREIIRDRLESGMDPGMCLTECNDRLMADNDSCMFATAFLCIADPGSGTLTYSCAGHPAPLLRTADGVRMLDVDIEPALGIFENTYSNRSVDMGAGDMLLMYTDGVVEAEGWNKERYGNERLIGLLESYDGEDVTSAVASDVSSFGEGRDQTDDITMVSVSVP